ncbi:uncharacterized protein LOC121726808 [Aricia agestis]|uniref:uncharacterized protein LOC121726808 n=1 Tax=Aricia agestis TaxID=91739 RepID=UPI001C208DAD|nr:uncharacterized protein LOC121726808 [Aricia agestis]XP_041970274.1 uncharacterized protein LOC121726808 [Aricia agestis]XP_041970276.1 uncharacterized protein LOC121726808 [Aricia agestis]XP_041970277.1 uncharacterized protein LOC121726808 [Aricia agestis]XP_041970278.1 uncharacterized protein LOC121726808 [Aricia agestis]
MESVHDRLNRLREERLAREKARIEKLRELNLKKYNKNEAQTIKSNSQTNVGANRSVSAPARTNNNLNARKANVISSKVSNASGDAKLPKNEKTSDSKPKTTPINKAGNTKSKNETSGRNNAKNIAETKPIEQIKSRPNYKHNVTSVTHNVKNAPEVKPDQNKTFPNDKVKLNVFSRRSFVPSKGQSGQTSTAALSKPTKVSESRKSLAPSKQDGDPKPRESVFDRLYKPKVIPKITIDNNASKLKTDPNYLKQVIRDSNLIINKRHTVFDNKEKLSMPVRRSISAVHFKRISKQELSNCVHKWASIGEKINKVHLNEVSEDESVKEEKVVSAVKSERKRVKFQTPASSNFNTPKPQELQERLQKWLQKRGKALDSYHHLQCFGLHHLPRSVGSISSKLDLCEDEENKENIALEHDSDNESYTENVNNKMDELTVEPKIDLALDKWRRASCVSDSIGFNESCETTLTSAEELHHVDELLFGALHDLTELLREGFDWEQCARWLRAIRERFPEAPEGAAYWECRAALEERRGDLSASVQCWERAIANGTEQSVVEANLDQLLDKFMQLKISPSSGRNREVDPKMVDVKNVFKSTIIRFAVRQAKLRQSNGTPKYTVTPVRRSSRISLIPRAHTPLTEPRPSSRPAHRTPLSVCKSFHQAAELFPVEFKPNKALLKTP